MQSIDELQDQLETLRKSRAELAEFMRSYEEQYEDFNVKISVTLQLIQIQKQKQKL